MYKTIIKNGTIIDGTGAAMFRGDVGIKDDRIVEIGNLQNEPAENVIDARGKFVAPGFIDVNDRSDIFWQIFSGPELKSLVYQGVTTIIGGNCGLSLAPLAGREAIDFIQRWNGVGKANLDWLGTGDFLDAVEKTKLALNFGTLVGHDTIRFDLLGGAKRGMDDSEKETARRMIAGALREGALGLSFISNRAHHQKNILEEAFSLAKISNQTGLICSVGLQEDGEDMLSVLGEAMEISGISRTKLHLSHFQVSGEKNWKKQDEALTLLEQARENGMEISFDLSPYVFSSVELESILPAWALEGGRKMMLNRIKDEKEREKMIQELKNKNLDYSKIIVNVPSVEKRLKRKNISALALSQQKSPEDVVLDLLASGKGKVSAMLDALSEENLANALAHPFSIVASNDSGYDAGYQKTGDMVHPRSFGTFPRVLAKYVREKKVLTWEEAIHKMTGKPAELFGVDKRGAIKKGNMADVVVFDPETVADRATIDDPFQYAKGIEWVMVNGVIVLQEGEFNGKRMGRIIRRKGSF